jgi:hypothetical protein
MNRKIALFIIFLLACNCAFSQSTFIPPAPDYNDEAYWYTTILKKDADAVDIFYVYPTLGTNFKDSLGQEMIYADVSKNDERLAAIGNQRFNKEVYAGDAFNFFSPYYRQITMAVYEDSPNNDRLQEKSQIAVNDIAMAFQYYINHINKGRPFILLGHSQGSSVLLELLKNHPNPEDFNSMIAAYLIGWQITEEELSAYPERLKPAQNADDTGVIILYNSLTNIEAKSPRINQSVVCINPLNWKTDATPADKSAHLGIVRYNKAKAAYDTIHYFTGAYIQDHYLICPDVDPATVYQESLKDLFPLGNLHFMDSWLYAVNLKMNMLNRTDKFLNH